MVIFISHNNIYHIKEVTLGDTAALIGELGNDYIMLVLQPKRKRSVV
jgi:hypothetical protein